MQVTNLLITKQPICRSSDCSTLSSGKQSIALNMLAYSPHIYWQPENNHTFLSKYKNHSCQGISIASSKLCWLCSWVAATTPLQLPCGGMIAIGFPDDNLHSSYSSCRTWFNVQSWTALAMASPMEVMCCSLNRPTILIVPAYHYTNIQSCALLEIVFSTQQTIVCAKHEFFTTLLA